jgi:hypothetical protein
MSTAKGYYSVIQYCPDLSRLEAANVGVLLFCPERRFIKARVSHNNDRIRKFFSPAQADWRKINAMKDAVANRIGVESEDFRTLEDLQRFIALQANEIQITPPRPMKVFSPEDDLEKLFRELVGGRARRHERDESDVAPVERLVKMEFKRERLDPFLRHNVTVAVKTSHRQITVPFGFQNGRFNLIQPARFAQTSVEGVRRFACEMAVEGRSLHLNPDPVLGQMQFIVVGAFRGAAPEAQDIVRDIFTENDVSLYSVSDLKKLADVIRQTGKPVTQGATT